MNIFIAGGTSGIGLALAKNYLAQGHSVAICGRDLNKLNLESSKMNQYQVNVLNKEDLLAAVQDFRKEEELNLFINCTGSYADDVARQINYDEAVAMLRVNIEGTVNCFEVARTAMKNNVDGQIVTIASVSGTLNYKKSSLYSKTKRSVIQIADAYRRALQPFGVTVTTLAPGYVDTAKLRELNQQDLSKKPYLISEQEAVNLIIKAIDQKKELFIFPKRMKLLMGSLALLPSALLGLIMFKKAKWMKND